VEIPLARTRFDLFAAGVLVVYAAVFTAAVWFATAVLDLGDTALLVVLVVLVVAWVFWSGLYVFGWTRMRRVDVPLALRGDDLHARSQFGELAVPWEAVQSVAVERRWTGRLLRVRLVPSTDPRFQQVDHTRLNASMFEIVQRKGLRYSLRVLDVDPAALREAFVVQSGGRVHVAQTGS
jgi:hypothetical protein